MKINRTSGRWMVMSLLILHSTLTVAETPNCDPKQFIAHLSDTTRYQMALSQYASVDKSSASSDKTKTEIGLAIDELPFAASSQEAHQAWERYLSINSLGLKQDYYRQLTVSNLDEQGLKGYQSCLLAQNMASDLLTAEISKITDGQVSVLVRWRPPTGASASARISVSPKPTNWKELVSTFRATAEVQSDGYQTLLFNRQNNEYIVVISNGGKSPEVTIPRKEIPVPPVARFNNSVLQTKSFPSKASETFRIPPSPEVRLVRINASHTSAPACGAQACGFWAWAEVLVNGEKCPTGYQGHHEDWGSSTSQVTECFYVIGPNAITDVSFDLGDKDANPGTSFYGIYN